MRPGTTSPATLRPNHRPPAARGMRAGEGLARFAPPGHAGELPAFPAYVREPRGVGPLDDCWAVRPRYSRVGRRSRVVISVPRGTCHYATGEQAGPLLRNGRRQGLWNYDRFDYDDRSPSLYQSHPFVLSVRADGSAMGVVFETTWRSVIDLSRPRELVCEVDGPAPAVLVIERPTPMGVVEALAELTGFAPMPPRWSLGYHQCRWSYHPSARVLEVAREFRRREIPADVIWMDIDYMDGFRCFTFDPVGFAEPARLNAQLHELGFRTVYMIDPGLKVDPAYRVYREARDAGHFVTDSAGGVYEGKVWPGLCSFPDFTRGEVRAWWAGQYREFLSHGIDGVWNDMNEPAVFEVPGKTMPDDNAHAADAELGGPGPHVQYHNIYGMQMVRATREGVEAARPDRRPFVLTRANFLGGQRYAATWTGDNRSDWRHLRWSVTMALNLGLSGQPFVGPDIGGFVGDADGALFARWMGIASLLPFCRAHSIKESTDHEPWSFGRACEDASRQALGRRYRLMPYLYGLFREASRTGRPVVRPMFLGRAGDPRWRSVEDCFLLGPDVLVRCNFTSAGKAAGQGAVPSTPPPPEGWAAFEPLEGEDVSPALPEVFVRRGAIVPMGPVVQNLRGYELDPLTLVVCPDSRGEAVGRLYEDDGETLEFRGGRYRLATFRAERREGVLRVAETDHEGDLPPAARSLRVVEAGVPTHAGAVRAATLEPRPDPRRARAIAPRP